MSGQCPECGSEYVFDEQLCSSICTQCGHLNDPAQTVLDSHVEHGSSAHPGALATASHRVIRNRKGWHLNGQSKQAREQRNMAAISLVVNSVLSRLNNPGLSPRAHAIFAQAMSANGCRWGRKAKLIAGASIAIALREARKPDSLRDIAFFLDETPLSISRTFQSVVSLLDLSLSSADPSVHIPTLQTHLHAVLCPESVSSSLASQLSPNLVAILTPLSLSAAVRTAISLSNIISNHVPPLPITQLPTPPTACALLILGLEAETRTPLPHVSELARVLASRIGLAAGVVSSRYRLVYDLIEQWTHEIPWLDQFAYKNKGCGPSARSKFSKRAIVAKGIKDVIQFHEEIWKQRMEAQHKINLVIEPDPGKSLAAEADSFIHSSDVDSSGVTETKDNGSPGSSQPHRAKRRRTTYGGVSGAYRFLLDPLSFTLSSESPCRLHSVDTKESGPISVATALLTRSQEESTGKDAPTRLQLLAMFRGGSAPQNIADEELFEQGELESVFRTRQEREILEPLFESKWGDDVRPETAPSAAHPKPVPVEVQRGSKRVDMEALRRILDGDADQMVSSPDTQGETDVGARQLGDFGDSSASLAFWREPQIETEVAEQIGDWRPLSPELGFQRTSLVDRYEEEY